MNGSRSIRRRIRRHADGVNIAADVNAEIAINTGGQSRTTVSRSVQSTATTQTSTKSNSHEDREKR